MSDPIQDKILSAVLDLQYRFKNFEERLGHLEQKVDIGFGRLDDFVGTINNHEAELAALRSAQQRLDERLSVVERKLASA